jgi:uncharacterized protein (TIGR00251 family)
VGELAVRLQPRAPREEVVGERDGRLLVRVTAAPVDGRANRALCRLIARRLGIARGRVTVVSGQASRDKRVRVDGVSAERLRRALGPS